VQGGACMTSPNREVGRSPTDRAALRGKKAFPAAQLVHLPEDTRHHG
jgi:hypothetical protein